MIYFSSELCIRHIIQDYFCLILSVVILSNSRDILYLGARIYLGYRNLDRTYMEITSDLYGPDFYIPGGLYGETFI